VRFPQTLLPLIVATLVLSGCGVSFSNGDSSKEFFRSLTVSGTPVTGAPLAMVVAYAQNNPIDVAVKCDLRQGKAVVQEVGTQTVPRLADGGPKATPVAGTYTFDFTVDQPGTYKAECYTPADENNYIIRQFTVRPGASSTPGG
jgi:hypothetical protein